MTSGPSSRLLAGFGSLADGWLNAGPGRNPQQVDFRTHPGRFEPAELDQLKVRPPSLRGSCLAIVAATDDGDAVLLNLRLAAAVFADDSREETAGAQARRLADRIGFELARPQPWAHRVFNPGGLEPGDQKNPLSPRWPGGPRGGDVSAPRDIRAGNLHNLKLGRNSVAAWAVTWLQQFRAREEDFDFPVPEIPPLPETVLAGFEPNIGTGHQDDYDTLAEPEGSG